ncbi:heavy-metal-associated domain-containing protein [Knoellia subterranea]|uniref:Transporter n=1 Tax=Knoellia subterranea KCTC 19937 TaxID=1385521 RepID=A0A0A0JJN8_9MICO|nr:heavy metal-associated domain-containing protein [Knoellia subterranea]KGN36267.1 transporter [Knoellia subterranea KCTC 19937]
MNTTTVTVQGMTCGGCATKVSAAVEALAGISSAEVDLGAGTLTATGQDVDEAAVRAAIASAGYQTA